MIFVICTLHLLQRREEYIVSMREIKMLAGRNHLEDLDMNRSEQGLGEEGYVARTTVNWLKLGSNVANV
jgi:hypothetical protein